MLYGFLLSTVASRLFEMKSLIVLVWSLVSFVFLYSPTFPERKDGGRGNRNPSAIADNIYDALLMLVKGDPLPPVKGRSRAQKSANIRLWRSKGQLEVRTENSKEVLFFKGRRMLRSSEINRLVADEFHRTKGSGARKIVCSLKDNFVGLSKHCVQDILSRDKLHYHRNARFLNKAILKPIRAQDVQVRHQVDLMDLGKGGSVKFQGIIYRYVLSVMDVFSRFIWLRPLQSKNSKAIAAELKSIYMENGSPLVLQSDQGSEFKGAVKILCHKMHVKMVNSRPYHPQSQGKVERSHRALRSKMENDLLKMGKKGLNWAKALPEYQRILNEDPKEVLKYKYPFEVYFVRKTSCHQNQESEDLISEELVANIAKCNPTNTDRKHRLRYAKDVRKAAHAATELCHRRMVKTHLKSNPPSRYRIGEKVHVRLAKKGRTKTSRKQQEEEALVEKRNLKRQSYKVSFISPSSGRCERRWFSVVDITSLTLRDEKLKQKAAKIDKQKRKMHREKFFVPMGSNDYLKVIEDQGYEPVYNPPGNGNCQFAALTYQLSSLGISRSPKTLREEIVRYLQTHPLDEDGFPLYEWVPHFDSWPAYLAHMAQDHTYGDQLTLFAAANLYNVNIQIVSSLGAGAGHVFHPSSTIPITTLYLGHFAENHGEHYIALNGLSPHDENSHEIPAESAVNQVQERSHNECDDNDDNNAISKVEEIRGEEYDNDDLPADSAFNQEKERSLKEECDYDDNDNGMLADSAVNQVEETSQNENVDNIAANSTANQVENASHKEGNNDNDDHGDDKVPSQLSNEVLDKIIDFALTGTEISVITTYSSLCQLGDRFKALTCRYISRLPRVCYSHRETARNGYYSMRKLCKEFGPISGLLLALKEIIASPKWINAWVELLFTGVGTWMFVTNVWWKGKGGK